MRRLAPIVLLVTLACGGSEEPDGVTLAAPANVTVTPADRALVVRWDPVPGAHSYDLHWSTSPGVTPATGLRIADVTNPFHMVELSNGRTYALVVTALGPKRQTEGPPSQEVTGTPAPQPPPAPRNWRLREGDGRIQLDWDNLAQATAYRVYWSDGGEPTTDSAHLDGIKRNDWHEGLENGRTYRYLLVALRDGLEGTPTAVIAGTPRVAPPQAPARPENVAATPHETSVTLAWNAAERATAYDVYWAVGTTVTKESGTKVAHVASPWTHVDATPGLSHAYLVVATNAGGESGASDVATATPALPAFSGPFAHHGERVLRDGALVLSSGSPYASFAHLVDGASSIELTLTEKQPGTTVGLLADLPLGDGTYLQALVGLPQDGPVAGLRRCLDASCSASEELHPTAAAALVEPTLPAALALDWNDATFVLTLTLGLESVTFDLSGYPALAGVVPTGTALLVAGELAGSSAAFDDLRLDGALADDFSGDTLDPARWRDGEAGTTTADGMVHLSQRTRGRSESASVALGREASVRAVQATLTGAAFTGDASAGLEATLAGGVLSSIVVTEEGAFAVASRCTDVTCQVREEELRRARIGDAPPGTELLVWRAGPDFVFRAGSSVTTWTAAELGLSTPTDGWSHAALTTSVTAPAGNIAQVDATFGDLRVW